MCQTMMQLLLLRKLNGLPTILKARTVILVFVIISSIILYCHPVNFVFVKMLDLRDEFDLHRLALSNSPK